VRSSAQHSGKGRPRRYPDRTVAIAGPSVIEFPRGLRQRLEAPTKPDRVTSCTWCGPVGDDPVAAENQLSRGRFGWPLLRMVEMVMVLGVKAKRTKAGVRVVRTAPRERYCVCEVRP